MNHEGENFHFSKSFLVYTERMTQDEEKTTV